MTTPSPEARADQRIAHTRKVRLAAERVVRLSKPGTPERLFALRDVAEEDGVSASEIVTALVGQRYPR